jgi:beta-lactamase superfamily II metal-dependent hydrolase
LLITMRKAGVFVLAAALCPALLLVAQSGPARSLAIYLVDVEGGNATLFVSPSGESLLIDAGNPSNGRDANRIAAAAKDAGISQIDHLIVTHYHVDHVGGVGELNAVLPIRHFIDHGPSVETNASAPEASQKTYRELVDRGRHTVVKPGDKIPIAGLDVQVLSAAGHVIQKPLPGAGRPNPPCAAYTPMDPDPTENAQSVGSLVTYGKFRTLHLGDLTWNVEHDLMCPADRIGKVDLFVVSHHGQPISNSPVLVHAIQPRVMLLNNGLRKGGQPPAMKVLHTSPGLEDLWQLHVSMLSGQEYTSPGMFIANLDEQGSIPVAPMPPPQRGGPPPPPAPVHDGAANWIKVSAQADGTFTVSNSRNGFSKTYRTGSRAATN